MSCFWSGTLTPLLLMTSSKEPLVLRQLQFSSVQFSSVTQSCPTLCNPMDCSMPGLPVHHQLPEFTQTHADCIGDAIQPSHPLSSPSPPAFNLSQNQGLFPVSRLLASGGQSIGASVSAPAQWIFRVDSL